MKIRKAIGVALLLMLNPSTEVSRGQTSTVGTSLTTGALTLINYSTMENRRAFYVYKDSDAGLNHGFPSGLFWGGPIGLDKLEIEVGCVYDPLSSNRCSADANRMDRERGTVIRLTFQPLPSGAFIGENWEEPENWGANKRGRGYDLRGSQRVCFDAVSPSPLLRVQFGVAGKTTPFTNIPGSWTPIC